MSHTSKRRMSSSSLCSRSWRNLRATSEQTMQSVKEMWLLRRENEDLRVTEGKSAANDFTSHWHLWLQATWRKATASPELRDTLQAPVTAWSGPLRSSDCECMMPQTSPAQTLPKLKENRVCLLTSSRYINRKKTCDTIWNTSLTSCNFLSSLLKLSSWPLVRTSGMSCHSAKAEPRDERKELDGDRLEGDGLPSDPSSLSPSSSVPGSFPCCLWISLLMATSLYSWYRMAAGSKESKKRILQENTHGSWFN